MDTTGDTAGEDAMESDLDALSVVITYWGGPEDGRELGTVPITSLAHADPHFRDSTHVGGYYQWDVTSHALRWHSTAPLPIALRRIG